ncbi:MAG: hypothetical protein DDT29_00345 [Dehalococcoidia bacterium]|nr:hypothetical protein [Bacillota bacterium]
MPAKCFLVKYFHLFAEISSCEEGFYLPLSADLEEEHLPVGV